MFRPNLRHVGFTPNNGRWAAHPIERLTSTDRRHATPLRQLVILNPGGAINRHGLPCKDRPGISRADLSLSGTGFDLSA